MGCNTYSSVLKTAKISDERYGITDLSFEDISLDSNTIRELTSILSKLKNTDILKIILYDTQENTKYALESLISLETAHFDSRYKIGISAGPLYKKLMSDDSDPIIVNVREKLEKLFTDKKYSKDSVEFKYYMYLSSLDILHKYISDSGFSLAPGALGKFIKHAKDFVHLKQNPNDTEIDKEKLANESVVKILLNDGLREEIDLLRNKEDVEINEEEEENNNAETSFESSDLRSFNNVFKSQSERLNYVYNMFGDNKETIKSILNYFINVYYIDGNNESTIEEIRSKLINFLDSIEKYFKLDDDLNISENSPIKLLKNINLNYLIRLNNILKSKNVNYYFVNYLLNTIKFSLGSKPLSSIDHRNNVITSNHEQYFNTIRSNLENSPKQGKRKLLNLLGLNNLKVLKLPDNPNFVREENKVYYKIERDNISVYYNDIVIDNLKEFIRIYITLNFQITGKYNNGVETITVPTTIAPHFATTTISPYLEELKKELESKGSKYPIFSTDKDARKILMTDFISLLTSPITHVYKIYREKLAKDSNLSDVQPHKDLFRDLTLKPDLFTEVFFSQEAYSYLSDKYNSINVKPDIKSKYFELSSEIITDEKILLKELDSGKIHNFITNENRDSIIDALVRENNNLFSETIYTKDFLKTLDNFQLFIVYFNSFLDELVFDFEKSNIPYISYMVYLSKANIKFISGKNKKEAVFLSYSYGLLNDSDDSMVASELKDVLSKVFNQVPLGFVVYGEKENLQLYMTKPDTSNQYFFNSFNRVFNDENPLRDRFLKILKGVISFEKFIYLKKLEKLKKMYRIEPKEYLTKPLILNYSEDIEKTLEGLGFFEGSDYSIIDNKKVIFDGVNFNIQYISDLKNIKIYDIDNQPEFLDNALSKIYDSIDISDLTNLDYYLADVLFRVKTNFTVHTFKDEIKRFAQVMSTGRTPYKDYVNKRNKKSVRSVVVKKPNNQKYQNEKMIKENLRKINKSLYLDKTEEEIEEITEKQYKEVYLDYERSDATTYIRPRLYFYSLYSNQKITKGEYTFLSDIYETGKAEYILSDTESVILTISDLFNPNSYYDNELGLEDVTQIKRFLLRMLNLEITPIKTIGFGTYSDIQGNHSILMNKQVGVMIPLYGSKLNPEENYLDRIKKIMLDSDVDLVAVDSSIKNNPKVFKRIIDISDQFQEGYEPHILDVDPLAFKENQINTPQKYADKGRLGSQTIPIFLSYLSKYISKDPKHSKKILSGLKSLTESLVLLSRKSLNINDIKQQIFESNSDSTLVDFLNSDFDLPGDSFYTDPNFRNIINIVKSKLQKLRTPVFKGGHFVQISDVFLETTEQGITWIDGIERKQLKDVTDGSEPYSEVVVSWPFDPNIYSRYVKDLKEGKNSLIVQMVNKALNSSSNKSLFGYRIPTQGASSTMPIKIVGFIHPHLSKNSIIAGNDKQIVRTGSDFDNDSFYVLFREYGFNEYFYNLMNRFNNDVSYEKTVEGLRDYLNSINDKKISESVDIILEFLNKQENFKNPDIDIDEHIIKIFNFENKLLYSAEKTVEDIDMIKLKYKIKKERNELLDAVWDLTNSKDYVSDMFFPNSGEYFWDILEKSIKDKKVSSKVSIVKYYKNLMEGMSGLATMKGIAAASLRTFTQAIGLNRTFSKKMIVAYNSLTKRIKDPQYETLTLINYANTYIDPNNIENRLKNYIKTIKQIPYIYNLFEKWYEDTYSIKLEENKLSSKFIEDVNTSIKNALEDSEHVEKQIKYKLYLHNILLSSTLDAAKKGKLFADAEVTIDNFAKYIELLFFSNILNISPENNKSFILFLPAELLLDNKKPYQVVGSGESNIKTDTIFKSIKMESFFPKTGNTGEFSDSLKNYYFSVYKSLWTYNIDILNNLFNTEFKVVLENDMRNINTLITIPNGIRFLPPSIIIPENITHEEILSYDFIEYNYFNKFYNLNVNSQNISDFLYKFDNDKRFQSIIKFIYFFHPEPTFKFNSTPFKIKNLIPNIETINGVVFNDLAKDVLNLNSNKFKSILEDRTILYLREIKPEISSKLSIKDNTEQPPLQDFGENVIPLDDNISYVDQFEPMSDEELNREIPNFGPKKQELESTTNEEPVIKEEKPIVKTIEFLQELNIQELIKNISDIFVNIETKHLLDENFRNFIINTYIQEQKYDSKVKITFDENATVSSVTGKNIVIAVSEGNKMLNDLKEEMIHVNTERIYMNQEYWDIQNRVELSERIAKENNLKRSIVDSLLGLKGGEEKIKTFQNFMSYLEGKYIFENKEEANAAKIIKEKYMDEFNKNYKKENSTEYIESVSFSNTMEGKDLALIRDLYNLFFTNHGVTELTKYIYTLLQNSKEAKKLFNINDTQLEAFRNLFNKRLTLRLTEDGNVDHQTTMAEFIAGLSINQEFFKQIFKVLGLNKDLIPSQTESKMNSYFVNLTATYLKLVFSNEKATLGLLNKLEETVNRLEYRALESSNKTLHAVNDQDLKTIHNSDIIRQMNKELREQRRIKTKCS